MPEGAASATIVIQTTVDPAHAGDFAAWQLRVNDVVSHRRGYIGSEVIPPAPPLQPEWVIVQRFGSIDAARAWLGSDERRRLLEEVAPWLAGKDDIHIFAGDDATAAPMPVSAVIATKVRPGREDEFRAWQRRIGAAQAHFPGYQGFKLEPPRPGLQDDWVTILRFDSGAHLEAWLQSPERQALLAELDAFTDEVRVRTVRTGFEAWFRMDDAAGVPPSWKQSLIVLLALYPVVFLFGEWVATPLMIERAGWPFWLTLFVSNAAVVALLAWIVPRVSAIFAWWLSPSGPDRRRTDLAGVALIAILYAACLTIFSQFP